MMMNGKYARGYIEVDLAAICANAASLARNLPSHSGIYAVLKADGYGHGAVPVSRALEPLPCIRGFAVATPEEAFALRTGGITKPLLVLGYSSPDSFARMLEEQIEITVFREDTVLQLDRCAGELSLTAAVHIKVDTGMSRLGIFPDDTGLSLIEKVLRAKRLRLQGIFTHFARADEADQTSALRQLARFNEFAGRIEADLGYRIPVRHCANSAAIIGLNNTGMDAVRAGIALYGIWPAAELAHHRVDLKPALSFYSQIIMLKEVSPGVPVSYGGTFLTDRNTRIATIPIGYADGYPRSLSNVGHVLINGQKAPILGRVCMDYLMADVTGIDGAAEGSRVTLLGPDGDLRITAEMLGELSGRFHYELVCDLGKRIPRIYTKGGVPAAGANEIRDFA